MRSGKLIGRENFFLPDGGDSRQEVLTAFIKQYYNDASFIPREIILPDLPEEDETAVLTTWLTEKAGHKVEFISPQRGTKRDLLQLADENAGKLLEDACARGKSA